MIPLAVYHADSGRALPNACRIGAPEGRSETKRAVGRFFPVTSCTRRSSEPVASETSAAAGKIRRGAR